jgi:uncharacterized repeat protein (TIGR01451 family)
MKRSFNPLSSMAVAAAGTALFLLPGTLLRAAGSQVLHGHVPAVVARLQPVGHLNGTNHLKLAIGLPLRDQEGLSGLLQQIYDPTSGNYHHYLTAAQFAERFGPTAADYQTLKAFAISHHLTVTGTHPNRVLLDVEGSVADVEKALNVTMRLYRHPTEPRDFFAPDTEPSIDLSLPVLHISGLDNYVLPHSNRKPLPLGPVQTNGPALGSGPFSTYIGYDFRAAYVPGVTLTGTGQSIGLFELDSGFYQIDITAYESLAGLPNVPVTTVLLDNYNGGPGIANDEVSLDIEMAISMAPGLDEVIVYEGDLPDDVLNRMATDDLANQLSASWTYGIDASTDPIFQQMAAQGQSFFNASGDSGAYPPGEVPTPSDDTNITIVGGTTLFTTGPGGAWQSEVVWSWFNAGTGTDASSGGISSTYAIPPWQKGISMAANQGSTTFRNLPDVALTADNIWTTYSNGLAGGGGGTSAATPLWAAFNALVNQQAVANAEAPVGFINPAIYAIGKGPLYSSTFHDIVSGNDTNLVSTNLFYAVPGYDLCTGWGTPAGSNLINALAPLANTPILAVVTNIISGGNGNGIIDFDECNNLRIVLTNSGLIAATGIEATLFSTTTGAIVAQGISAYPTLPPHGVALNETLFALSTEPTFICGTPIHLALVVKCDQVLQTNYIQLSSGVPGVPVTFTSSTVLTPSAFVPTNSPITVSGLQSVGKVTVSVYLTAPTDSALSLQLISPGGTNVILSQDNGGSGQNYGQGCNPDSETIFDDAAAVSITSAAALPPYIGPFQPQQPLSAFNLLSGTNLNGIWNLQVLNMSSSNTIELECWSINISPEVCVDGGGQCPGANLSLTMSANPTFDYVGSNVVYSLTVSNAGPSPAQNVVIVQNLPVAGNNVAVTGVTVISGATSFNQSGSILTMTLPSLPVYGTDTVLVSATFTTNAVGTNVEALLNSVAGVTTSNPGPNPGNTTASATVFVTEPVADLAVTMTGSPGAVLQEGLLTYAIIVTNNGPFTAEGVTLTVTLPANANFISATTSQGMMLLSGTFGELGDIPVGTNVVVTIVVSPTITGNITAGATVALGANSGEIDPDTFNNSASVTTTVGPAADLGITAIASPSPAVAGHYMTYWVTVSNAGPSPATGVVFSQSLPAGSTFANTDLPGHTVSNNLITATFANLASESCTTNYVEVLTPTLPSGTQSNLISTMSVFGQPGDPNPGNNVFTLTNVLEPPTVTIVAAGATLISGSSNGAVGTNGSYSVRLYLQNVGNVPTTMLVATLQNGNGVTSSSGSQTYGILYPEIAPTAGQYSFTASGTNGGTILAVLQLQDGSSNLGTVTFTFVMPVVQTCWNTNSICIPSQIYIPEPDSGPANPYPSAMVVSNINGDVSAVTVTVSNLIHSFPNDIGMLLVGPSGASCVLMSAAANESTITTPITVTFDQNAALVVPPYGEIVSGSYQPADYYASQHGTTETFSKSPVPVGPYNTNLAVFAGTSANGTWSLYIEDDTDGDAGTNLNGWGLAFTTITPVNQVADLAAGIVASASQVTLGDNITNIWTVTDSGPDAVTNVYVTNILSPGLTLVTNILPSGASVVQTSPAYVCNLGSLIAGGSALVTNVVTANSNGPQTNLISVGSTVLDGNPADHTASVVTIVTPPPVDLIVAPISVTPNPAFRGGSLVYVVSVTNNGPSNAFGVVGSFALSSLDFVSAVPFPSQGASCISNNGFVVCSLGTIPAGSNAGVTIAVTAPSTGVVTNVWSVLTTSSNINSANSSVSASVTVVAPTAVITNGPAALVSQGSPPFNGAINFNQTNTVSFTLLNIGSGPTTNLIASLLANSGVSPITVSRDYGSIAAGGSASQSYTFVSGSSGSSITAELSLQDEGNANLGPVFFTFMLPVTQSFANPQEILIPYIGPASPYPSSIQISGLANSLVSGVSVTLNGFTHSWPHDVEAVLVSPAGQEVALMEHTGAFYSVTNLILTFSDAVEQGLPLSSSLISGTFLPTEYSPFDTFPTIGAVPANSTNLAVFNGTSPDNIWSLYVYDDTQGNNGVITGGWSLDLTTVSPLIQMPSLSASRMAGKSLQLSVVGSQEQSYGIQISSNLVSWTTILTNTGSFTYTDSLTNASQRFYRAILLSQ